MRRVRRSLALIALAGLVLLVEGTAQEVPIAWDMPRAFVAAEADLVVLGLVLGRSRGAGADRGTVVLLVEALWKGASGDTLTVLSTAGIPCGLPPVGQRTMVFAQATPAGYWAPCIGNGVSDDPGPGASLRRTDPERIRALAMEAIPPGGRATQSGEAQGWVDVHAYGDMGAMYGADVAIGPVRGATSRSGRARLGPLHDGLYLGAVQDPHGPPREFLVLVRCDSADAACEPIPALIRTTEAPLPTFRPFDQAPGLLNEPELSQALRGPGLVLLPRRSSGSQAVITAYVFVAASGIVESVHLAESSGRRDLDEAAYEALWLARYSSATNRGRQVPVWISVPIGAVGRLR